MKAPRINFDLIIYIYIYNIKNFVTETRITIN